MSLGASTVSTAAAALVLVLGLIWLAARAARLFGPWQGRPVNAAVRRLVIRQTLALDRTRRLHVVRCDDRELLILTGGPGDLMLGWLPPLPPGAEGPVP